MLPTKPELVFDGDLVLLVVGIAGIKGSAGQDGTSVGVSPRVQLQASHRHGRVASFRRALSVILTRHFPADRPGGGPRYRIPHVEGIDITFNVLLSGGGYHSQTGL